MLASGHGVAKLQALLLGLLWFQLQGFRAAAPNRKTKSQEWGSDRQYVMLDGNPLFQWGSRFPTQILC